MSIFLIRSALKAQGSRPRASRRIYEYILCKTQDTQIKTNKTKTTENTYTHTQIHTYTHTHINAYTHTHTYTNIQAIQLYRQAVMECQLAGNKYRYTYHRYTYHRYTYPCTFPYICPYTYTYTFTCTYTCIGKRWWSVSCCIHTHVHIHM